MSGIAYVLLPPVLAAPACVLLARWVWLRSHEEGRVRISQLLLVSLVEVLLWTLLSISITWAYFGGPFAVTAVTLAGVMGVGWWFSGIWLGGFRPWARALYVAVTPIIMGALAVTTWLVVVALGV